MPIIILLFLVLAIFLIFVFSNFDKLVQMEYENHKEDWIKDGKPRGFFWRSPESTWFGSSMAMQRLSFLWLFKTPHWIYSDSEATQRLKRLRFFVLIINVGIIAWFLISMTLMQWSSK